MDQPTTPRLGVNDKRKLFAGLIALCDRLLYLNKFPVDQQDFALSCVDPEVEAAWRLLRNGNEQSTSPTDSVTFQCYGRKFFLHLYPEEYSGYSAATVFMDLRKEAVIDEDNRFRAQVREWAKRQLRLEEQLLRAAKVIKAIVHSCNTVGQYKRVSPDLLGFLPDTYKLALKDYIKTSPYPAMTIEPEEIETTMATMAFAALQPPHESEEDFNRRKSYQQPSYTLKEFPRTKDFTGSEFRRLEI